MKRISLVKSSVGDIEKKSPFAYKENFASEEQCRDVRFSQEPKTKIGIKYFERVILKTLEGGSENCPTGRARLCCHRIPTGEQRRATQKSREAPKTAGGPWSLGRRPAMLWHTT